MPTLRRFRSGPHGGVACDADLEAVAALPPRPSKPAWPRCLPSDDSAPDRTEASLAMPTWRPWRLCRRGRLNPLGRDAYPQTIPLRTARRRRLRCRPGGRGGFAAAAVQTRLAETPTLRRFRSAPHGGVACDADLEAVAALPPRPSKPAWPRRLPSDDSAPHRTEASLAMPTWRPWRLCRRGRPNPLGRDAYPQTIPLRTAYTAAWMRLSI